MNSGREGLGSGDGASRPPRSQPPRHLLLGRAPPPAPLTCCSCSRAHPPTHPPPLAASDALDKIRLLAVQDADEYKSGTGGWAAGRGLAGLGLLVPQERHRWVGWAGGGRQQQRPRACLARVPRLAATGAPCRAAASNPIPPPIHHRSPPDLEIRIRADPAAQTIVIEDSGVGLTREEILDTLGTIAKSGGQGATLTLVLVWFGAWFSTRWAPSPSRVGAAGARLLQQPGAAPGALLSSGCLRGESPGGRRVPVSVVGSFV